MNNSYEILEVLVKADLIKDERDQYWWPNSRTFEVVVGAILTQQTKWQNVEKALGNLHENNLLNLNVLAEIDVDTLAQLIKSSGFYNMKAKRLKDLCIAIVRDFGDFESFKELVSREWLLSQKGIGRETADSILCYGCAREIFVVDNYTDKLLRSIGYEFDSYEEIQSWMMSGIEENFEKIRKLYSYDIDLYTIYTRFHGKIVELGKSKKNIKEL
jgi:endonuclease-3 related protein